MIPRDFARAVICSVSDMGMKHCFSGVQLLLNLHIATALDGVSDFAFYCFCHYGLALIQPLSLGLSNLSPLITP
jgi:hypothetical protein